MKLCLPSVTLLYIMAAVLWPAREVEGVSVPKCDLYQLPGCTKDLNPVCGTDGRSYSNECMLCSSNRDNGLNVQINWMGDC